MKKISKLLMLLMVGAGLSVSFSSCSDDNDDEKSLDNPTIENRWTGVKSEMWQVAEQYLNAVVYPTYTGLANRSETLYEAAVNMKSKYEAGTLTDADVETAAEAFKDAREYWEKSEAFLYGAASDFEIDPHIDSWPLDQGQMAQFMSNSTMVNGLYSPDPIAFVRTNYGQFDTAIGFHGIEFVLFRNGAARPASAFSGIEDHSSFAGKTVQCKDELAFLVAVTGDVRDHCYWLEVAWKGTAASKAHRDRVAELGFETHTKNGSGYFFGANMLLAADGISTMLTINDALVTLTGASGCGNICNEVAEQKLGQAYRVSTGQGGTTEDGEAESADYIESPYSKRSFIDYRDNIYSIKNSLYGNFDQDEPATHSVLNFLKDNGYTSANGKSNYTTLNNALNEAIQSLTTPINEGKHFVDNPGADYVKTAIDAIANLNTELEAAASWIEKQ